jgi:hypothetical protein
MGRCRFSTSLRAKTISSCMFFEFDDLHHCYQNLKPLQTDAMEHNILEFPENTA